MKLQATYIDRYKYRNLKELNLLTDQTKAGLTSYIQTDRRTDRKKGKNTEGSKTTTPIQGLPEENVINKKIRQADRQTDRQTNRQTDRKRKNTKGR